MAYFSQPDSSISPYGSTILTPGSWTEWCGVVREEGQSLRAGDSHDPQPYVTRRLQLHGGRVGGLPLSGSGLCDAVIMTPIVAALKGQREGARLL